MIKEKQCKSMGKAKGFKGCGKLTDKTKYDFNNWFIEKYGNYRVLDFNFEELIIWYLNEIKLPNNLINYIIIDFFDSVDIYIDIIRNEGYFEWYVNNIDGDYGFINRHEAIDKAIEKANEIYNKK